MPAALSPIKMSWIPKESGKGGTFTNLTYHDADPESTNQAVGCHVQYNAWVPNANYVTLQTPGPTTSLHIFNRYSGITQTIASKIVAGVNSSPATVYSTAPYVLVRGGATPMPTTGTGRFCFATVKNRLYMANGTDAPAISPDATASSCIPWGGPAPQTPALTYQIVASNQLGNTNNAGVVGGSQGVGTVTGGTTLTWNSGVKFDYFVQGAVIYVNGVYNTIQSISSTTVLVLSLASANVASPFSYAPTGIIGNANYTGTGGSQAAGTTVGAVLTWTAGVKFDTILLNSTIFLAPVGGGVTQQLTVNTITNSTTLTLSAAPGAPNNWLISYGVIGGGTTVQGLNTLTTWAPPGGLPIFVVGPPTIPYGGSPTYIAGATSPANPSTKYTLTAVTGANAGTISPTYAEATGGAQVTRNTQINISNITFDNGRSYQYAVSYWSPPSTGSGHVTNPSPILNVKDGAPANVNVSVTISNIVTTNDATYTKIILWRSAAGGSNLFPLAILNNNTGNAPGATITYTDYQGDDTTLGSVPTGPGKLAAPRGENAPPPSDLNYIAYWDGRFWGASQTQVGVLFFSARSAPGNPEDISVGVAEECWPPNFTRTIPESDGRITGLRTVGANLFVLTDNNIYAVVGSNWQTYGLARVSAKGAGTSHFATCVLPAEDTNSTDVLVHFGNDSRLYFLFGSGGDFPISYPIQNQLTGVLSSSVVVGLLHAYQTTYIVMSSSALGQQYFYDLERKLWFTDISFVSTAFTEGLYSSQLTALYGNSTGFYVGQVASASPPQTTVYTNVVSPGGMDRKDDKLLESVAVYYDNAATAITVNAVIDGATVPCTQVTNTGNYAAYFENPDARIFVPQGTTARGRLFQLIVQLTPANFTDSLREIVGTWSSTASKESVGGKL